MAILDANGLITFQLNKESSTNISSTYPESDSTIGSEVDDQSAVKLSMPPRSANTNTEFDLLPPDVSLFQNSSSPTITNTVSTASSSSPAELCQPIGMRLLPLAKDYPYSPLDNSHQAQPTPPPSQDSFDKSSSISVDYPAPPSQTVAERLQVCTQRLQYIRSRSINLIGRLLLTLEPPTRSTALDHDHLTTFALPGEQTDDESSVSSNEELDESETSLDGTLAKSDQWLCSRALIVSNWNWLLSEQRRSCRMISALEEVKHALLTHKEPIHHHDDVAMVVDQSGSRSLACHLGFRRRLRPIGVDHFKFAAPFPRLSCTCSPSALEHCILCRNTPPCSSSSQQHPTSSNHATSCWIDSICPYIHRKLSNPIDIPLTLRLEARWSSSSSNRRLAPIRRHRSTTVSLPPNSRLDLIGQRAALLPASSPQPIKDSDGHESVITPSHEPMDQDPPDPSLSADQSS